MAIVFMPAMLQPLTGGVSQVRVAGRTIRTIINNLEERFPGVKERLLQDGDLRPDVAIAVDGEMGLDGLAEQVGEDSEVHFIPPISGGRDREPSGASFRHAQLYLRRSRDNYGCRCARIQSRKARIIGMMPYALPCCTKPASTSAGNNGNRPLAGVCA